MFSACIRQSQTDFNSFNFRLACLWFKTTTIFFHFFLDPEGGHNGSYCLWTWRMTNRITFILNKKLHLSDQIHFQYERRHDGFHLVSTWRWSERTTFRFNTRVAATDQTCVHFRYEGVHNAASSFNFQHEATCNGTYSLLTPRWLQRISFIFNAKEDATQHNIWETATAPASEHVGRVV